MRFPIVVLIVLIVGCNKGQPRHMRTMPVGRYEVQDHQLYNEAGEHVGEIDILPDGTWFNDEDGNLSREVK